MQFTDALALKIISATFVGAGEDVVSFLQPEESAVRSSDDCLVRMYQPRKLPEACLDLLRARGRINLGACAAWCGVVWRRRRHKRGEVCAGVRVRVCARARVGGRAAAQGASPT